MTEQKTLKALFTDPEWEALRQVDGNAVEVAATLPLHLLPDKENVTESYGE